MAGSSSWRIILSVVCSSTTPDLYIHTSFCTIKSLSDPIGTTKSLDTITKNESKKDLSHFRPHLGFLFLIAVLRTQTNKNFSILYENVRLVGGVKRCVQ